MRWEFRLAAAQPTHPVGDPPRMPAIFSGLNLMNFFSHAL